MNVDELIELLQKQDPTMPVIGEYDCGCAYGHVKGVSVPDSLYTIGMDPTLVEVVRLEID